MREVADGALGAIVGRVAANGRLVRERPSAAAAECRAPRHPAIGAGEVKRSRKVAFSGSRSSGLSVQPQGPASAAAGPVAHIARRPSYSSGLFIKKDSALDNMQWIVYTEK